MFIMNYEYSNSIAIVIVLSIGLAIGIIGLSYIFYKFFIKKG